MIGSREVGGVTMDSSIAPCHPMVIGVRVVL